MLLRLPLQVVDSSEDGPDLERLLQAVTPVVSPSGDLAELTLVSALLCCPGFGIDDKRVVLVRGWCLASQ